MFLVLFLCEERGQEGEEGEEGEEVHLDIVFVEGVACRPITCRGDGSGNVGCRADPGYIPIRRTTEQTPSKQIPRTIGHSSR